MNGDLRKRGIHWGFMESEMEDRAGLHWRLGSDISMGGFSIGLGDGKAH